MTTPLSVSGSLLSHVVPFFSPRLCQLDISLLLYSIYLHDVYTLFISFCRSSEAPSDCFLYWIKFFIMAFSARSQFFCF